MFLTYVGIGLILKHPNSLLLLCFKIEAINPRFPISYYAPHKMSSNFGESGIKGHCTKWHVLFLNQSMLYYHDHSFLTTNEFLELIVFWLIPMASETQILWQVTCLCVLIRRCTAEIFLLTAMDGRPSQNSSLSFTWPRMNSANQLSVVTFFNASSPKPIWSLARLFWNFYELNS